MSHRVGKPGWTWRLEPTNGGNSFTPARSERVAFPTRRQCTESRQEAHEQWGLRQCTELLDLQSKDSHKQSGLRQSTELLDLLPHRGQLLAQVCRLALHLCHHRRRRLVHKLLVGQARLQGTKERQQGSRRLVDQRMQHDARHTTHNTHRAVRGAAGRGSEHNRWRPAQAFSSAPAAPPAPSPACPPASAAAQSPCLQVR